MVKTLSYETETLKRQDKDSVVSIKDLFSNRHLNVFLMYAWNLYQ